MLTGRKYEKISSKIYEHYRERHFAILRLTVSTFFECFPQKRLLKRFIAVYKLKINVPGGIYSKLFPVYSVYMRFVLGVLQGSRISN